MIRNRIFRQPRHEIQYLDKRIRFSEKIFLVHFHAVPLHLGDIYVRSEFFIAKYDPSGFMPVMTPEISDNAARIAFIIPF